MWKYVQFTWAACVHWWLQLQQDWSRSSDNDCHSAERHAPEPAWATHTHTHTHQLKCTHRANEWMLRQTARTIFSFISSFCVIWMRVWNSLLWCWIRISQVSPYPPWTHAAGTETTESQHELYTYITCTTEETGQCAWEVKGWWNVHLHAEIQRSDSILVSKVFGSSREQDLCGVSLTVATK